jgi:NAD(P)-dependent dehydrogenase (short-subunit alcohol dehydrogenase family)
VELNGAAALVTGGARGIGAAVVERLQAAGARVAVLDVDITEGQGDLAVRCDVGEEDDVVAAVTQVRAAFGALDVAVLNAGVGGMAPIVKMSAAEWDRVHRVNTRGTFLCLRECARTMVADGNGGAVVVTSSVSGFLTDRLMAHYSVSKAAVSALTRVAARELGPHGIRVNAVAPGTTATPMFAATDAMPGYAEQAAARTPLGGRLGTAGEVADAIVALTRLDWVTGQTLVADGGVSLWSPIDPAEQLEAR